MESDKIIFAENPMRNTGLGTKWEDAEYKTTMLQHELGMLNRECGKITRRILDGDNSCIEDDYYNIQFRLRELQEDIEKIIEQLPI